MSANLESIRARIRALLAKTERNGCTEAEAAAAAAKAAELMDAHSIALADLAEHESIDRQTYTFPGQQFGPVVDCANAIAEFCDVKVWCERTSDQRRLINYFGRESDAQVAVYLTHLFANAIKVEWQAQLAALPPSDRPHGNTLRASFCTGMATRLASRLREMKKLRNAKDTGAGRTGRDLVIVKNAEVEAAFQTLCMTLKNGRSRKRTVNAGAFAAGQAAGNRVHITAGIGTAGTAGTAGAPRIAAS